MKKLFLSLTAGLFLTFSASSFAAPQADSCLKMIWPNNYNSQGGYINPDSVKVDSCLNSFTYRKLFAAKYYFMQFALNSYPFAEVLKKNEVKNVNDILPVYAELRWTLLNLQKKVGNIYFQGLDMDTVFVDDKNNPVLRVYFDNYQNIDEITKNIIDSIATIRTFQYHNRSMVLTLISWGNENRNDVFPNPSKEFIKSETFIEGAEYTVINELGINLQSGTISGDYKIDVRNLLPGMYYIRTSYKSFKFIKE